jgi:hypothetical protein
VGVEFIHGNNFVHPAVEIQGCEAVVLAVAENVPLRN